MNRSRKSKGIVIELTALLDVIFIMLFWVMMNVQNEGEAARQEAKERIAAAEQQVEQQKQETDELLRQEKLRSEAELENVRRQAQQEIKEAQESAKQLNMEAYANQMALEGYEQGLLITLSLTYDDTGELVVSNNKGEIGRVSLSSRSEISAGLISALSSAGREKDDVILCAMVYEGKASLYQDVRRISSAVDDVKITYKNFYCTYINTSK